MVSFSQSDVVAEIRARSEYDENYVTDAHMALFIQASYDKLYEIARSADTSRFICSTTFNTIVGTTSYAITCPNGSGTESILSLIDIIDSDDQKLTRVNWADRARVEEAEYTEYLSGGYRYNFRNGKIYLYPSPTEVETLTVTAIQSPEKFANGPIDLPNRAWVDYVIYDTLSAIAAKAEDNPSQFLQRASDSLQIIVGANTDIGAVSTIGSRKYRRRYRW